MRAGECGKRDIKYCFKLVDEAGMGRVGLNGVTSFHSTSLRLPLPASTDKSKQCVMPRSVQMATNHEASAHDCMAFLTSHNSSGSVVFMMGG